MADSKRRAVEPGIASGVLGGGGAGLLTVVMPVLGLTLLGVGVVVALARSRTRPDTRTQELRTLAGYLMGSGALFSIGSLNVIVACSRTSDFCGAANPAPLLIGGLAFVCAGAALAYRTR